MFHTFPGKNTYLVMMVALFFQFRRGVVATLAAASSAVALWPLLLQGNKNECIVETASGKFGSVLIFSSPFFSFHQRPSSIIFSFFPFLVTFSFGTYVFFLFFFKGIFPSFTLAHISLMGGKNPTRLEINRLVPLDHEKNTQ